MSSLGPDPWYSRFAWSNVYPVGPDYTDSEAAGSPWGLLKAAQDDHVGPLLEESMRMLDARRIVVVSGPAYWWAPARRVFADLQPLPPPLAAAGRKDGRTWVVGYHPAGALRKGYSAARYAELISATVRRVEATPT